MSDFKETFADLSRQIREQVDTPYYIELIDEWKQYHEFYIKSKQWADVRKKRMQIDKNTCQKCGAKKHLQVHHLTYENIGEEEMEDLLTVCKPCHMKIHGRN
jgi:5-methylcytosine-specific restriction endonuclease McrA